MPTKTKHTTPATSAPPALRVPLLDLTRQYATIREEIAAALDEVLASQHFILGPVVAALEKEIAAYCGTSRAVGCGSGSDAILLVLMALGVGPGDEVICPSYTFFATAGSVARLGARPVFADIDPVTFNIDIDHAREVARSCRSLKAIMPVHLYGQAVDMDGCLALGEEFGVPVIEDVAQAIGARDATGRIAGSRGLAGCFSFFPTKNLGGYGEGGIITTNDEALARKIEILRVHGMEPKYYHQMIGVNSRLDALQAAVVRVKLRHLESWHEARRTNARHYDRLLAEAAPAVRTPRAPAAPARHIYNQYVIRVDRAVRDGLRAQLAERGVATEIYYPVPLHLQECFTHLGYGTGDLPHSEAAAKETIALPVWPELTAAEREHVARAIVELCGARAGAVASA